MKKIYVVILMAIVMMISPVAISQAESESVSISEYDTGEAVKEIKTHTITTGSDKDFKKTKKYNISLTPEKKVAIIPMKFSEKGILYYNIKANFEFGDVRRAGFGIFSDKECTEKLKVVNDLQIVKIKKAGTYYAKVVVEDIGQTALPAYDFEFASQFLSAADKKLSNNKEICSGVLSSNSMYYKVNVPSTGKLEVLVYGKNSNKVTLCNDKKKAISSTDNVENYIYGVNKGTYYIRVNSNSEAIGIKSSFKKISDKSSTSKKKAKNIKIGSKATKGIVTATEKSGKADWYKFTNSKNKKVRITYTANVSSGKIEMELYQSNGKRFGKGLFAEIEKLGVNRYSEPFVGTIGQKSGKLPKGTYYIKVTKIGSKTSGDYSLKVK